MIHLNDSPELMNSIPDSISFHMSYSANQLESQVQIILHKQE